MIKKHPSGAKARVDFGGIRGTAKAVPLQSTLQRWQILVRFFEKGR
jgi:hypothetical protein